MKLAKKVMAILLAIVIGAGTAGICMPQKVSASDAPLTGLSAQEIVDQMGIGWNLGNSLDAQGGSPYDVYTHERAWGNPKITKELIHAVREAGFDTIRIPTTWFNYMEEDYTIKPAYMNRVKEIVTWAYEEGMFIILNVHHEEWVNDPDIAHKYVEIGTQLSAVWKQIAENFAEFDQHLIFEGMNEPRAKDTSMEWSGNASTNEAVNYLCQVFVNTVRLNAKGYNAERALMVPGYAASCSVGALTSINLPVVNGKVCNNLIVSVHSYTPYEFCLTDSVSTFDENNKRSTSGIDQVFDVLDSLFLSKGIPVVMGETGATAKNNTEQREKWFRYMGKKSKEYGVPIVVWDNGNNSNAGGESHAYFNRRTCEINYPTVFNAMFEGYNSAEYRSRVGSSKNDYETSSGTIVFKVNGSVFTTGSRAPSDAGYTNMDFMGWYFTKDYRDDSKYEGGDIPEGSVLYAKLELLPEFYGARDGFFATYGIFVIIGGSVVLVAAAIVVLVVCLGRRKKHETN